LEEISGREIDARQSRGQQVGSRNTQFNFFADHRPVSWPHVVGAIPRLADGFLRREVSPAVVPHEGPIGPMYILFGLGGAGKTQIVAAHVREALQAGTIDLVVWITATFRSRIVNSLHLAAADVTGIGDADPEDGARRLLFWLSTTSRRWLMVLDDLQSPADMMGLWPTVTAAGQLYVTTRRRDSAILESGRSLLDVGVFSPAEAELYLAHKLNQHLERMKESGALAADLGYLPLALAQAAAYILDRNLTCAAYRRRLARKVPLEQLLPEDDALPDDHRATVAATWLLSVDAADRMRPEGVAGPILMLAALLDANGIPVAVFRTSAAVSFLKRLGGGRSAKRFTVDSEAAVDALNNLHRLSLVSYDVDVGTVRIHALVQRAVRDAMSTDVLDDATRAAADALYEAWPGKETDINLGQTLRANTAALHAAHADPLWSPEHGCHKVLFRAGMTLGLIGQSAAAAVYYRDLLATAVERLGVDHRDTLTARHGFGRWTGQAGAPAAAVAIYEALVTDWLRVHGPDDPGTLAARHGLARWRGDAGDPAGAVRAYEELLVDRLRVQGADHPETLISRHGLARWLGEAGDPLAAAAAFQALLAERVRVFGPDHVDVLATRESLSFWLHRAGDIPGALDASRALLVDMIRLFGPDHPRTLTTRASLARSQAALGDVAGAVDTLTGVLADRARVLGPGHPRTVETAETLHRWREQLP
jgi:hypothetical protein